MDRVTYLIPAGEKTTMVVSAGTNKKILRVVTQPRTPVEGTTDLTQRDKNELTCRSFHFSTDKPSTRDTILPKKIRKVTIHHQRRRDQNRQTLAETNQKTEKAKRKYQPLSYFFKGYESFSIRGSRTQKIVQPTRSNLDRFMAQSNLVAIVFKLAPNFRFFFGPTRDSPALSVFSFPEREECVWV